jgi:prepilin signal peptidase PulO-like enzyme (type II secretory pathway)
MGDIKLLGVTGLYMGLDKIGSLMFPTLILMFFVSLYLLTVKKVSRSTEIAFAPYLLVGTILSAFLMGV